MAYANVEWTGGDLVASTKLSQMVENTDIVRGEVTRFVPIVTLTRNTFNPANTDWTELDLTDQTSANAIAVCGTVGIYASTAGRYLYIRAKGSTSIGTATIRISNPSSTLWGFGSFQSGVDSEQILEWSVSNADVTVVEIIITGYWETVA